MVATGAAIASAEPPRWPDGARAAIVLTYDDALKSQLDVAVPQLDEAGLKGTFFLSGTFDEADVDRWRAAARGGHELANHSVFHPCPERSFKAERQYYAESYSVAGMLREIGAMNTLLHAIDGGTVRTYATPCSQSIVGGVDYIPALRKSGLVKFVRAGGDQTAIVTDIDALDPYAVPSFATVNGPDGAALVAYVQRVAGAGGLGVIMFHGVGGDYLTVSADAHRTLVTYLREHRREIWVGTFNEVLSYAEQQRIAHGTTAHGTPPR
jgi:peptidoglycan/xylan/chitin deacetylase (PgdA/CDA1 family)